MNAPFAWNALEGDDLRKPVPLFYVQAPDGRKDWAEIERQIEFRKLLKAQAPSLLHYPNANAGKRNPSKAIAEGIVSGVFDVTVSSGVIGPMLTAWIEFKGYSKQRPGALSRSQIDWGNARYKAGHPVACFFCPVAAVEWLRGLFPMAFVQ